MEFVGSETMGGGGGGRSTVARATRLGAFGSGDGEFHRPSALALVPGLCLVVRELGNRRLQVFATPDVMLVNSMSHARVAWLVAVARGILHRQERLF